jgi:zinc protease
MQQQGRALLSNQMASPDFVFNNAIESTLSGNNPRRAPETPATVDQWDLNKSLAFYKARFADASNFTFVFTGSFTVDAMRPFVETYIASLPATHAHETWRDIGIKPPRGIIEKTVEKGIAPKAEVAIVFSGPFEYDEPHRLALRTATLLLQSRLSDTIRQQLGGTYSITAEAEASKVPSPEYNVKIDWTCDPARAAELTQRVLDEVAFVRRTLLGPDQMSLVRASLERDVERSSEDNGYLLGQIARRYEEGEAATVGEVMNERTRIAALTGAQIQDAAMTYLDLSNYVKVTLLPEQK